MQKMHLYALVSATILILIVGFLLSPKEARLPILGDIHHHADFKVYLDGELIDFNQTKYMSTNESQKSPFLHVHDYDGEVVHQHMSTTTLAEFFASLGMNFTQDCFTLDDGRNFCNSGSKTLKMYVNGVQNTDMGAYDFNDLDRILLTYGDENQAEIAAQIQSVTDRACIYSETCPERGKPPDESSCSSSDVCVY